MAKPQTKRAFDKDVTADVTDAMTYTVKAGGTATKIGSGSTARSPARPARPGGEVELVLRLRAAARRVGRDVQARRQTATRADPHRRRGLRSARRVDDPGQHLARLHEGRDGEHGGPGRSRSVRASATTRSRRRRRRSPRRRRRRPQAPTTTTQAPTTTTDAADDDAADEDARHGQAAADDDDRGADDHDPGARAVADVDQTRQRPMTRPERRGDGGDRVGDRGRSTTPSCGRPPRSSGAPADGMPRPASSRGCSRPRCCPR